MSGGRRGRGSAASPVATAAHGEAASGRRAPKFLHYVYLNLAVWLFLAVQAVVLTRSMGSSQSVLLFTAILGLGFLAVSVFDYLWLRGRDAKRASD